MTDSRNQRAALHVAVIAAAVFAVYVNSLHNGFINYDDVRLIIINPVVTGFMGFRKVFTSAYWYHSLDSGLYRPVTILLLMFEYRLAGPDGFIYHLNNVVLHALCSVLVYLILRRVLSGRAPLFAALIFAVHPVHVESVAWIAGRAEVLAAFFALTALWVATSDDRGALRTALAAAAYGLGLLSKESAAVMPGLLAAWIIAFEARPVGYASLLKKLAARLWPYIAVFALYVAARLLFLNGSFGPSGTVSYFFGVGPFKTALTMLVALMHYIRLAFLPFDLRADYTIPLPDSILDARVVAAAFLIAGSASIMWVYRKSGPVVFAAASFFLALLPVSNIFPTEVVITERAAYLPLLGVCILFGMALTFVRPKASLAAAACVVLLLSAGTVRRNTFWADAAGFEDYLLKIEKARYEYRSRRYYFATEYAMRRLGLGDYSDETRRIVEEALSLDASYYKAHYLKAEILEHDGRHADALAEVDRSIGLFDEFSDAYDLRGMLMEEAGRPDEAEKMRDRAVRLDPNNAHSLYNKALSLAHSGRAKEALTYYERLVGLYPDDFDGLLQMGITLGGEGRYAESADILKRAVLAGPGSAEAHYFLAIAEFGLGNIADCRRELTESLRLAPGNRDAAGLLNRLDSQGH